MNNKFIKVIVISMSLLVLTSCVKQAETGRERIEDVNKIKNLVDIKVDDINEDLESN